ncbi:hypothetical protein [Methylobacterium isbiliense]|jgi:hypothetical protein|nr:hypothetical protein [Methylobacterium isbiliense]MDN3627233.1 hypothetical protein [Methylobacterium isbiliense]
MTMGAHVPPKLDTASETERLQLLAPKSLMHRINDWRRQQPDLPNLSEAVRRLVEAGLDAADREGGGRVESDRKA